MVLTAMKIKEWKDQGRKERAKREDEAYAKFGVEMNGVLMLPRTPEVVRFLSTPGNPQEETPRGKPTKKSIQFYTKEVILRIIAYGIPITIGILGFVLGWWEKFATGG